MSSKWLCLIRPIATSFCHYRNKPWEFAAYLREGVAPRGLTAFSEFRRNMLCIWMISLKYVLILLVLTEDVDKIELVHNCYIMAACILWRKITFIFHCKRLNLAFHMWQRHVGKHTLANNWHHFNAIIVSFRSQLSQYLANKFAVWFLTVLLLHLFISVTRKQAATNIVKRFSLAGETK